MANLVVFFFTLIFLACTINRTRGDIDHISKKCRNVRMNDNASRYYQSYKKVVETMKNDMKKNKFATGQDGEQPARIHMLSQCMDDLSEEECASCFSKVSSQLAGCVPRTGGRIFLDGCYMRFDNYSFFHEVSSESNDITLCSLTASKSKQYTYSANVLMKDLVEKASSTNGFAMGTVKSNHLSVYGMVSCWKTLDKESCAKCLSKANYSASECYPLEDSTVLNTGCFLRYANHDFVTRSSGLTTREIVLVCIVATIGGSGTIIAFVGFGVFIFKKRASRKTEEEEINLEMGSSKTMNFRFEYTTLQKATDNFSDSRKVGQGGFGEVFKGSLPDGREIAIKRLFIDGKHQVETVCNEMDIICLAQHRNLVRFLGSCFNGDSLLVYEFVANGSIDKMLFHAEKKKELDWKKRIGIIRGVAEGLEYLHKDCQVRIVHRDIKASNILLDMKFKPKISDFGLARFYSSEKINSRTPTTVAGTLGYMAPEYLSQGRLTEKADVYSFGVLVLEIISGTQNNKYDDNQDSDGLCTLVTATWKHFKENTAKEIIDKSIEVEDLDEAVRMVQIGLLCTQESLSLRPTMTNVVQMLTHNELELPTPTKPPFADEFVPASGSLDSSSSMSGSHQHCISIDSSKYEDADER